MAVSEKDFRELSSSVAEMRGALKICGSLAGVAILGALGWSWHLGTKVAAMEQQLADGGNTKIVAQLKKPASAQQLQANLSTVIAQVQTAQVSKTKLDSKKIAALSDALSEVVRNEPNLSEAWQAAAQLISYRSNQLLVPQDGAISCDQTVGSVVVTGGPSTVDMIAEISFSGCILDLDRPDLWSASTSSGRIESQGETISNWHLKLHNVVVHYTGGPLTHISEIVFDHCMLDFQLLAPPSAPAQRLTKTLLAANDINNISFQIPAIHS